MRDIGQATVPTSETDREIFLSLRLAEPSERVKITLDERMLCIEGKRNATVDMRLHAITTMRHHSTNLVPGWLVVFGFTLLWIGYRLVVPPTYRLMLIGIGSCFIAGRFLTRKPTLSIHTSSGDSHVLFGNERDLNRLSFMFNHLANNNSMAEVRAKLEAIEAEGGVWRQEERRPPLSFPTRLMSLSLSNASWRPTKVLSRRLSIGKLNRNGYQPSSRNQRNHRPSLGSFPVSSRFTAPSSPSLIPLTIGPLR